MVYAEPTSTTNITGFRTMWRGSSLTTASRSARRTIGPSNSARARASGCRPRGADGSGRWGGGDAGACGAGAGGSCVVAMGSVSTLSRSEERAAGHQEVLDDWA